MARNENPYALTIRVEIRANDDVGARLRARLIRDKLLKLLNEAGVEADVKLQRLYSNQKPSKIEL